MKRPTTYNYRGYEGDKLREDYESPSKRKYYDYDIGNEPDYSPKKQRYYEPSTNPERAYPAEQKTGHRTFGVKRLMSLVDYKNQSRDY